MAGSARLLVVLVVGIIVGILVGGYLSPALYSGLGILQEDTSGSVQGTGSATGSAAEPTTAEHVATTVTYTYTRTITVPVTITSKETVRETVTSTATRTVTETVTETVQRTATRTITTTRTITLTVTETPAPAVPSGSTLVAWNKSDVTSHEKWWLPRLFSLEEKLFSRHGLEVYRDGKGFIVLVNKNPDPLHGYVFLIEDKHGRRLLVLWPFNTNKTREMIPAAPAAQGIVGPELVIEAWPLSVLASLGQGEYRLVAYQEDGVYVACSFTVTSIGDVVFSSECTTGSVIRVPEPLVMGSYRSILDALVHGLNSSSITSVGHAVLGGGKPSDTIAALWSLLAWAEESLEYDYDKYRAMGEGLSVGVQSPLETIQKRRGVCSDYAVLLSAAIGYLGLPAMVLALPKADHVVAATVVNDTVLVLDQKTPVIELQDYLEYIAPDEEEVTVYLVASTERQGSTIVLYRLAVDKAKDSYPADTLEPSVVEEAVYKAAAELGMEPNPSLGTVAEWFAPYYKLSIPVLAEVKPRPAPLDALYTPLFHRQWTNMIAEYIKKLVAKYYPESMEKGSMWALAIHTNTSLILKTVAVPIRYNITVSVSDTELAITVASPSIKNPVKDIAVLVYRPRDKRACAGVAPPGYYYENIPYINAKTWEGSIGKAEITVSLEELSRLLAGCGKDSRIGIWINGSLVYLTQVPPQQRNKTSPSSSTS